MYSDISELRVLEYELLFDYTSQESIVIMLRRGIGVNRWSINNGSRCLSKVKAHGKYFFEPEPLPSSRDDEYYHTHRFSSAQAALDFWNTNRDDIIATMKDRLNLR